MDEKITKGKQRSRKWFKITRIILEIICIYVMVYYAYSFYGLSDVTRRLVSEYDELEDDYNSILGKYESYQEKMKPFEQSAEEEVQDKPVEEVKQQEIEKTVFQSGTYKVGVDMPAGEYVLLAEGEGYFSLNADSTDSIDSIICNDNFDNNSIVTIADNQYFQFKNAMAIPIEQNPAIVTSRSGMFKVGVHILAGEYKVVSDGGGYIQISSDSTHSLDSIVSNDNFEGEKYITVSDGQYLILNRAHIQL